MEAAAARHQQILRPVQRKGLQSAFQREEPLQTLFRQRAVVLDRKTGVRAEQHTERVVIAVDLAEQLLERRPVDPRGKHPAHLHPLVVERGKQI